MGPARVGWTCQAQHTNHPWRNIKFKICQTIAVILYAKRIIIPTLQVTGAVKRKPSQNVRLCETWFTLLDMNSMVMVIMDPTQLRW